MVLPRVDGMEAAAGKAAVAWGYAAMALDQPADSSPIGQERGEVVEELAPSFHDVLSVELKDR
ncbi:hypothetical protein DEDE109153_00440 [Deinococcus deserti]|uniref:Uncharacterized protein n=1 Tax=Deinococcus deserti (strain DSM 17065 / CIP 109153 / LMG 22923 / VCD115) TaxID=546414 RepID=C1CVZ8_DEIDV|nr:hypothetical protein [Deinococcus deserti]ACO46365.1 Hypothetical protein Deide_14180 [Deinococcus deserti VCD115]